MIFGPLSKLLKGATLPAVEGVVTSVARGPDQAKDRDFYHIAFVSLLVLDGIILLPFLFLALLPVLFIIALLLIPFYYLGRNSLGRVFEILLNHYLYRSILTYVLQRQSAVGGTKLVPVTHLRIRDWAGNLHEVLVKGMLHPYSTIVQGDLLRVWGSQKNGIILFRRAHNIRTGTKLEFKQERSRRLFPWLASVTIIFVAVVLLSLASG